MSFTSVIFLVLFLPPVWLLHYLAKDSYKNGILLAASAAFYAWCGLKFLLLLLVSVAVAYVIGRLMETASSGRAKRAVLVLGIVLSLAGLVYYKYFYDCLTALFQLPVLENLSGVFSTRFTALESVSLPLGISFYTFSVLSYLLDVYWEKCEAQHNLARLCLYVMFFPRVVQGPIMRYDDFMQQLDTRSVNRANTDRGIQRFVVGMFKKLVIADQLADLVSYSFDNIAAVGTIPAWLGIIGYLLQLYYDFSGYSDMAVGLGLMFGIALPENFDHPYLSETVAEFWRRWHSTLGEWFRDYLYMPLYRSFLRGGVYAKIKKHGALLVDLTALLVTWILTGIWHGSGPKFFIYGIWYFLFIAAERIWEYHKKLTRKRRGLPKKPESSLENGIHHVVTLFAVLIGQVLFRADSVQAACRYVKRMFVWDTRDGWVFILQLTHSTVLALVLGLLFVFPVHRLVKGRFFERTAAAGICYRLILCCMFLLAFLYAVGGGYAPFLYQVF